MGTHKHLMKWCSGDQGWRGIASFLVAEIQPESSWLAESSFLGNC